MAKNSNRPQKNEAAGKEKKPRQKTTAVAMAEKRASQRKNQAQKQKREKGRIKEYFKGVRLEMKKVVWPTRKELGSYTAIVLATCAAFALLFWGVDSGVLAAIKAVCF